MDENEVEEARKRAENVADDVRDTAAADRIENVLEDDSILKKVKDAAEDAVESVKNWVSPEPTMIEQVEEAAQDAGEVIADTTKSAVETVKEMVNPEPTMTERVKQAAEDAVESVKNMVSHEPTIVEQVQKAAQDAGEAIADTANTAVETVKEMVYPEPTITEQVKEVAHDTGEAVVDTANTAIDSVKEMVTPEPTFMEKVHIAYHDAEETVEGWWRRVYEWWNPPWFTDDDGLTFIGVIFYLLLAASFVAICWFSYRWYRNRQTTNNAVQNLENVLEDDSSHEDIRDEDDELISLDELGETELTWAADSGSEDVVAHLLTLPTTNIDDRNVWGETALLIAAWYGNLGIVKLLLANGASIEATDKKGANFLVHAALGFKNIIDDGEFLAEEYRQYRQLITYLVEEVGLPVPDKVLELLAEDPETLAVCQRARVEVTSLQVQCRATIARRLPRQSREKLPNILKNFVNELEF